MSRPFTEKYRPQRTGLRAEAIAVLYLRLKLYRIIARNWRSPAAAGEVDIIATRGRTLAFVEVKARATNTAGRYAILPKQQARITRAAEAFLARRPECATMNIRFDLMVITPLHWPDHIQAAWRHDSI